MQQYTAEEHARARAMAAEVQALGSRNGGVQRINVDVELFDLFRVIGCLQLAWRHPNLDDVQRDCIERFARQLQGAFDADECPALAETLEQGWHREYDR